MSEVRLEVPEDLSLVGNFMLILEIMGQQFKFLMKQQKKDINKF